VLLKASNASLLCRTEPN